MFKKIAIGITVLALCAIAVFAGLLAFSGTKTTIKGTDPNTGWTVITEIEKDRHGEVKSMRQYEIRPSTQTYKVYRLNEVRGY